MIKKTPKTTENQKEMHNVSCAILLNSPRLEREICENFIICADGGIKHIGDKVCDVLIGDFDSYKMETAEMENDNASLLPNLKEPTYSAREFTPLKIHDELDTSENLSDAKKEKVQKVITFPKEKNSTDGALAVRYALENGFKSLSIYGMTGGRADHVLSNLSLLTLALSLGGNAVGRDDGLDIYLASETFNIKGAAGDMVTIMPYLGDLTVKHSRGLYYPLDNLFIPLSDLSRGMSNIMTESSCQIEIESGLALIFHYF